MVFDNCSVHVSCSHYYDDDSWASTSWVRTTRCSHLPGWSPSLSTSWPSQGSPPGYRDGLRRVRHPWVSPIGSHRETTSSQGLLLYQSPKVERKFILSPQQLESTAAVDSQVTKYLNISASRDSGKDGGRDKLHVTPSLGWKFLYYWLYLVWALSLPFLCTYKNFMCS